MNRTKQILEILGIKPYKWFQIIPAVQNDSVPPDPELEGRFMFDGYFVLYKHNPKGDVRMGEYIPDIVAGLLTIQYIEEEKEE